ncbi:isoprenoid synthase domain-containing protein [Suillus subalutaceus]|uniref:isoprenoid synthase domain-containing protein n=1 Tax=Suillus subalutaceus TaxID=48586 RepID=UPI001B8804D4|nr:isoprenoid synthase domain-containing protein [Suillus subalutaceus]KAG1873561.1 isoprenoid synthase domain-containing protein [Suillus subalutaceus]
METRPKVIYLPDTMTDWPWPHAINPHFEAVKIEADAWVHSFKTLDPEILEAFDKSGAAYLVALGHPTVSGEHLRVGCEAMDMQLVVDEVTDRSTAAGANEIVDIVVDALHNPHKIRPEGEHIIGEMMRQCSARAMQTMSMTCQRRFIDSFTTYLRAVAVEVIDREQRHCRSIDDHFKHRRESSGILPWLMLCGMEIDLPDEVFYHPAIVDMVECAADLVTVDNDMLSWNREQASGIDYNSLITVVMLELGLDIGSAMGWAAAYHTKLRKRFIGGLAKIPSWGPSTDSLVKEYLDRLGNWVRAANYWSFDIQRYFGIMSAEIQQTRLVPLLPKVHCKTSIRGGEDRTDSRYGQ